MATALANYPGVRDFIADAFAPQVYQLHGHRHPLVRTDGSTEARDKEFIALNKQTGRLLRLRRELSPAPLLEAGIGL